MVHDLTSMVFQMSQLHWHVVDSQSFPLEVPGFEEVAAKGAYSPSMVYSPSDIEDIVSYAGQVAFSYHQPFQLTERE